MPEIPELIGLVLAGGRSARMGRDKGALAPHGVPQTVRCRELLAPRCGAVYVSAREKQRSLGAYAGEALLLDDPGHVGPAAGLTAAWRAHPSAALLVLAVDLVLIDGGTLDDLISGRDPARVATAFRHPDGALEPLCAIWEPAAAGLLESATAAGGGPNGSRAPSLRRILETGAVAVLDPAEPARLVSANTPAAYAAALAALAPESNPGEPDK